MKQLLKLHKKVLKQILYSLYFCFKLDHYLRDGNNKKIITIPFKKEREDEDSETYFNFYKEYLTKILDHL